MESELIPQILIGLIAMILSLTVHEYAHARVAFVLGDDTAAMLGRMTLNPIPHIDIIGTLVIPILATFSGGLPLIGWAKPVPVNPVRVTRKLSMHSGNILISVAGPISNLLLATLAAIIIKIISLFSASISQDMLRFLLDFFFILFSMNLGLAVFNLIPIPPLDGSHLLPRSLDPIMEKIRPFSYIILMAVIYFGGRYISIPIRLLGSAIFSIVGLPNLWG